MGDTGSMFLGFVLATTSLQTHQKSSTAVALLVPIVVLGLPIGDTLLSMTRRAIRGQRVFASDRGHIHHRLMALGLSHRETVLALYAVGAILAGVAVGLTRANAMQTLAYLAGVLLLAFLLLTVVGYVRIADARRVFVDRRRNLEMRGAVRDAEAKLRSAAWLADVWTVVKDAAPALGAGCVALTVVQTNGDTTRTEFSHGFEDAGPDVLRATYSLLGERPDDGGLELGWTDGRETVDRDTEIAVELLCEHVYAAVGRIEAARRAVAEGGGKVVNLRR
jgi:UDP-GlcNAc:undecaprenyl-phosphate GlcNAc-1-phosphate transferase